MSAYFVDALRNELPEYPGWRWYANGQDGEGATISYALMTQVPFDTYTGNGNPNLSFQRLDAGSRDLVERAMAAFSAVANITFTKVSEVADPALLVGSFNIKGDIAGYAGYPSYIDGSGLETGNELWLDTGWGDDILAVMLHELGHALGLEHPFEGDDRLPKSEDLMANTVMSYAWDIRPTRLGLFDVAALQSIYGPPERRLGDDTYVLGKRKLIWDGGGHDLIDASSASKGVTLKLADGTWSHLGAKSSSLLDPGQVWLGHFSQIEDAQGSRFGDRISGNEGVNALWGRGGSDTLDGGEGEDSLWGGTGGDRLRGGTGRDALSGGDGADWLVGGAGADTLRGGGGADLFVFVGTGSAGAGDGRDVVLDLGARDRIDLSDLGLSLSQDAFTGAGRELMIQTLVDRTLLLADIDGDGMAEFEIALIGVTSFALDQLIL